MGSGIIKLAGIQFAGLKQEKERNTAVGISLIRRAAQMGAQIVMTPEVVVSGFVGGTEEHKMAESIPGETSEHFCELARELGIYILVGLSERFEGQIRNAMAVLSPAGELIGVMRKVHINRYETRGGWRNGSEFPVWEFKTETGAMKAGIMICYDREVPESARLLMLQGAEVIFNPLACGCPTDDIHRCLLRTRAFENEAYILVVNHAAPRQNGHSMAIDYRGNIVEELEGDDGILLWDVDLDALTAHRKGGIYGPHHRRPELYGPLCEVTGQMHPRDANLPLKDELPDSVCE
jgi:predicted amidohydrolase